MPINQFAGSKGPNREILKFLKKNNKKKVQSFNKIISHCCSRALFFFFFAFFLGQLGPLDLFTLAAL